jgi:hypothetical protein
MARSKEEKFFNTTYVDPTGRIERVATSPEEAERWQDEGFTEGELAPPGEAKRANAGREGNRLAAESSTTRKLNDGVDRTATSNS